MERKAEGVPADLVEKLAQWNLDGMDTAKIGEKAPDFTLSTVDGEQIKLSSFQGENPVVLVFVYGDT